MSATATATKPKSATVLPLMAGHQAPRLTHADFMHHMTAMNVHYKAANSNGGLGPTRVYTLPIHMMFPPIGAAHRPTQGKAEVDAALGASKATTTAFAQNQKNAVDAATNKLQSDHDTSAFGAAMNAQRQKAKEESDRHIDDTFNKLIEIGTKHPEQQHRILSVTQQLGAFMTSLLANVAGFFMDIYNKIVGWINSAVDWVKGAAAAAGEWLSGAVSSIGHFFSSL